MDWTLFVASATLGLVAWNLKALYAMNAKVEVLASHDREHDRRLAVLERRI